MSLPLRSRFEIVATRDGFVDASTTGVAERDGQVISVALSPKQENVAEKPDPIEAGRTSTKPTSGTKTKPRTGTKPSDSNTSKPGFDPNEVGGD